MNSAAAQAVLLAGALVATGVAGIRWLRVAQREHYLPGSITRFARRWWSIGPNRLLGAAALLGLIGAAAKLAPAGLVAAAAVAAGPFGLTLKGRTSPLVWTRRLKALGAVSMAIAAVFILVAFFLAPSLAVAAAAATLTAVAAPFIVDAALAITAPMERRLGARFVGRAQAKLASVHPTVVAITGSYGKTSTKGYVAHLVEGSLSVVPTPKSYNNQSGLSRAVNEQLLPATDVFVAEMGTYGPGEIAEMCAWVRPDIAVITAIGPVHLERMGSEEAITGAKAEILEHARVAVLNVDSPWLAPLADAAEAAGKKVWRCSAGDRHGDVSVVDDEGSLSVFANPTGAGDDGGAGEDRGDVRRDEVDEGGALNRSGARPIAVAAGLDAPPTNVACAVAVALELGITPEAIARRLPTLPPAAHRRQVSEGRNGATVIDDTYNANPAGAAGALRLLGRLAVPGARRVLVTPGMVELGARQDEENARFAEQASAVVTHLLVVGRTNAASLMEGWRRVPEASRAQLIRCATRAHAVEWVSQNLSAGDVVLYENDLPDHFP